MENKPNEIRNAAIDLLRIISMYMVVVLHINGLGGVMVNVGDGGVNFLISYAVEQLCFVAVNLFALISGYCAFGRKFKVKNIFGLWLQVIFYSVSITFVFIAILGVSSIPLRKVIGAALPVLTNKYWYFTSYVFLFFLAPALNSVIEKSSKRIALLSIVVVMLLCTADGIMTDMFKLNGGYSPLWLAVVYTVGAFCKKWNIGNKFRHKGIFIGAYFVFSLIGLAFTYLFTVRLKIFNTHLYTFPVIVLASISFFLFFANVKMKPSKILTKISSASFAVYIIHMQPILCDALFRGKFEKWANANPLELIGILLLVPAGIYVICTLIEILRQRLFRLIGVEKLLDHIQNLADNLYKKYILD